jgi:hypothetical protein
MCQVIYSVIDKNEAFLTKKELLAHAETTYSQYIEIIEKYNYYWKLFMEQKELFLKAFVTRNELFSKNSVSLNQDTEGDDEEAQKIAKMMFSMDKGDYQPNKGETRRIEMK